MTPGVESKLAIDGGVPVRTEPLPLEFPGVYYIDEQEVEAAARVLRSRSLFRYYGLELQCEAEQFEAEFRALTGARHALAVSSGTGALHVALTALGVGPGQEVIIPAFLRLFERTLMLPIPSCLTEHDENDIIAAYRRVTAALAARRP